MYYPKGIITVISQTITPSTWSETRKPLQFEYQYNEINSKGNTQSTETGTNSEKFISKLVLPRIEAGNSSPSARRANHWAT